MSFGLFRNRANVMYSSCGKVDNKKCFFSYKYVAEKSTEKYKPYVMQICIWISKGTNSKIIPISKKLGLQSPEAGECLAEVKRKDGFVILKVIVL